MQTLSFRAMHSQMAVFIDSDRPSLSRRLNEVPAWFESWEQRLSRFRPDSELSRLNQAGSGERPVSTLMVEVLQCALRAGRLSAGLVTPFVLDAVEAAGYDRSYELLDPEQQTRPGYPADNPQALSDMKLHPHRRTVFLPGGKRLDLGGVAKGWAADRSARRLGKQAPALVDAGGDIAVSGPQASGEPWPVAVADPFNPGAQLDLVLLQRGGVATSGRDFRRWKQAGAWQHHIIDPRTGRPALTDVISATVVASSALVAEAAAKAALILGSAEGVAWLDAHHDLAGLLVLESGETVHSRRWLYHIWRS